MSQNLQFEAFSTPGPCVWTLTFLIQIFFEFPNNQTKKINNLWSCSSMLKASIWMFLISKPPNQRFSYCEAMALDAKRLDLDLLFLLLNVQTSAPTAPTDRQGPTDRPTSNSKVLTSWGHLSDWVDAKSLDFGWPSMLKPFNSKFWIKKLRIQKF